jgi:hypothetical protein
VPTNDLPEKLPYEGNPHPPDNSELWKFVQDLNNRVSVLEHRSAFVSTAFPKNDLGEPDYDGHRRSHLDIAEDAKVVSGFKQEATKNVIKILVTVVLTLLVSGFFTNAGKILTKLGSP